MKKRKVGVTWAQWVNNMPTIVAKRLDEIFGDNNTSGKFTTFLDIGDFSIPKELYDYSHIRISYLRQELIKDMFIEDVKDIFNNLEVELYEIVFDNYPYKNFIFGEARKRGHSIKLLIRKALVSMLTVNVDFEGIAQRSNMVLVDDMLDVDKLVDVETLREKYGDIIDVIPCVGKLNTSSTIDTKEDLLGGR